MPTEYGSLRRIFTLRLGPRQFPELTPVCREGSTRGMFWDIRSTAVGYQKQIICAVLEAGPKAHKKLPAARRNAAVSCPFFVP